MDQHPCLVGDIGGTHARLALAWRGVVDRDKVWQGNNDDWDGIAALVQGFMDRGGTRPDRAVLAMAGPVRDNRGALTNRDWPMVDGAELALGSGLDRVVLINDLVGMAMGLDDAPPAALVPLVAGSARDGPVLVAGIGTGFNTALRIGRPGARAVVPAEAGHAALPLSCGLDAAARAKVSAAPTGPSIEDALSVRGLARLHAHWSGVSTPITPRALGEGGAAMRRTAHRYARLVGATLGNVALHHLPLGGIILTGGVARALGNALAEAPDRAVLAAGFNDIAGDLLPDVPISVLTDDWAALRGCAILDAGVSGNRQMGPENHSFGPPGGNSF